MPGEIPGIHHVTAIAAEPQRNLDFYTAVLGLHLVKLTVNYDDPGTYHFYFGDAEGRPGTILTFFPWPGAPRGHRGTRQATSTSFSVPAGSLPFWTRRLRSLGIAFDGPVERFGEEVVGFSDPDGLGLELVSDGSAGGTDSDVGGAVPSERAIRGFHGVTLTVEGYERTAGLLTETLGFRPAGERGNRFRYRSAAEERGSVVDLLCLPAARRGTVAAGTVHHVAFRTADAGEQVAWRERILQAGHDVTPVIDRYYFRSVYFREPGGILFEIATDPPGFAVDEPADRLGSRLALPGWLEAERDRLERILPPVRIPRP
jgi:glyoxalase family protein